MSFRRVAVLVVTWLTATWLPALAGAPASYAEPTLVPGFVRVMNEFGDDPPLTYRSDITASAVEAGVQVEAGPLTFVFTAPYGRSLVPGRYPGATRYPFQEGNEPGLSVSGGIYGCNRLTGEFTVLDLASDRIWITYEQRCEGGDPAVFGEIKLGSGFAEQPGLEVEAGELSWPAQYPGVPVLPAPVRVSNTGSAATTIAATVPAGDSDFSIELGTCAEPLAAGSSCTLHVGFTPTRPGTRLGMLRVSDDGGEVREVGLSGHGIAGLTEWRMQGDPGDYISGGQSYDYTAGAGARINGGGDPSYAWINVEADGHWWSATFEAPEGQSLVAGQTYTPAARSGFDVTVAGLDVSGSGRGCNELSGQFTLHEATFLAGRLVSFRISFEQFCEHSAHALRGELSWRATDPDAPAPDTTVPAPVTDLVVRRVTPGVTLTWRNPTTPDWVDTVVIGTPGTYPTTVGRLVYAGRRQATTIAGLVTSQPYMLTVYTQDTSGNLSPIRSVRVPAAGTPGTTRVVELVVERVNRRFARFRGIAGSWAAGARAVLERRTLGGWTKQSARRFSDAGTVRWIRVAPTRVARYRLVTRVEGQIFRSVTVRFPRG